MTLFTDTSKVVLDISVLSVPDVWAHVPSEYLEHIYSTLSDNLEKM